MAVSYTHLMCIRDSYIAEEGIGIRIEDDVVVTKDGCEIITSGMMKLSLIHICISSPQMVSLLKYNEKIFD